MVGLGCPPRHPWKGTAVSKYPSPAASSSASLVFPEQVTICMASIAQAAQEGLLALAVGAGLQVLSALMDAEVEAVCGPKGRHDTGRVAYRHGSEAGSVLWVGGGSRSVGHEPVRSTGPGRSRSARTRCSTTARSSGVWRWRRCWLGCPPAGKSPPGWNQADRQSSRSLRGQAGRRCLAGSWR